MSNTTLETCIKEYLEEKTFAELLQLITDILRSIEGNK